MTLIFGGKYPVNLLCCFRTSLPFLDELLTYIDPNQCSVLLPPHGPQYGVADAVNEEKRHRNEYRV